MGVLPTPRKIKIPTGDSNSEASSAPQTGQYFLTACFNVLFHECKIIPGFLLANK